MNNLLFTLLLHYFARIVQSVIVRIALANKFSFTTINHCVLFFAMKMALFEHPFTCIVAGPTKVGKTECVKRFILLKESLMFPTPVKVIWCYTEWQSAYEDLVGVEWCEGVPDLAQLKEDKSQPKLLVLDDLMDTLKKDSRLTQLFIKGAHHWNVSIIHICQALFFEGLRTARLNAHYLVLMKSPSDKLPIANLAKQVYPGQTKFFMEAYNDATSQRFGYLILNLSPTAEDNKRLLTNIFNLEYCTVYIPKG